MLPFTVEEFFDVFAAYNAAVWPAPVAAYPVGLIAFAAAYRGGRGGHVVAAAMLALLWAWTGIAYHWLAFAPVNPAAWLFGGLFVGEGMLLLRSGIGGAGLRFGRARGLRGAVGLIFIAYALLYPLLGMAFGHSYPRLPMFGITPCPLVVFTLGMFLCAAAMPPALLIVPVLWSLIGGSAAFLLGVPQDWLLLASGPATLFLMWRAPRP